MIFYWIVSIKNWFGGDVFLEILLHVLFCFVGNLKLRKI